MRNPLQAFTEFTNTLLPHETEYLLAVQQFQDVQRLEILRRVDHNAHHIEQFTPYDTRIDKRKYNHLQNWIRDRLSAIDVDEQFNWMLDMERKIMTDTIQSQEEKALLKAVRSYVHPAFFFAKFYELVQHYRQFLLIRIRISDHQLVDTFLQHYHAAYLQTKVLQEKLHEATRDIVGQYAGKGTDSRQWEDWLSQIFYDENLEGQTRYLALVRLVFISHNYRKYDLLRKKFDHLDLRFSEGQFYSKRLMLNYYNNRLMLHSHFKEYDQAVYFGYLSIRVKNHDYLLYVNNLCAVLLRLHRHQEALQLMKAAAPEAQHTKNFHNRVGFVAFYMQALNKNGMYKNAENYGNTFLKAYTKEVLQYRWHLFFSVFLEAMLQLGHYELLLKTARKYKLEQRDKAYWSQAGYLPVIPLCIATARYKEGLTPRKELLPILSEYQQTFQQDPDRSAAFQLLWAEFKSWVPELRGFL